MKNNTDLRVIDCLVPQPVGLDQELEVGDGGPEPLEFARLCVDVHFDCIRQQEILGRDGVVHVVF